MGEDRTRRRPGAGKILARIRCVASLCFQRLDCSGRRVVLPVDRGLFFARSSVVFSLRGLVSRLGRLSIYLGHRFLSALSTGAAARGGLALNPPPGTGPGSPRPRPRQGDTSRSPLKTNDLGRPYRPSRLVQAPPGGMLHRRPHTAPLILRSLVNLSAVADPAIHTPPRGERVGLKGCPRPAIKGPASVSVEGRRDDMAERTIE